MIPILLMKDLVYNHWIRIVSVSEGIDSSQANRDLIANFSSWTHEQVLKNLRAAVLRGQEHAVRQDWWAGDWCVGYDSEPIPGSELSRRGRHPRPRMRVIINSEQAEWVRQIFGWFVENEWSMRRIAKELTARNVPKDHRALTPGWHPDYVRRILVNQKYIGLWQWGKLANDRDPLTGRIFQESRSLEEIARWTRVRPDLRIVEDEIFLKAAMRLEKSEAHWAEFRKEKGKLTGSRRGSAPARHILQSIMHCGACGRKFHVSGDNGNRMCCSGCK